jgi:hypothetical protein
VAFDNRLRHVRLTVLINRMEDLGLADGTPPVPDEVFQDVEFTPG